MLSRQFLLTLLSVQQAVASPADDRLARPVGDQTVMEERISGLLPLFKMTSPASTTAVVFGPHSRYPSRSSHPDLLYSAQIFIELSNRETGQEGATTDTVNIQ